jgi:hypothetical protein
MVRAAAPPRQHGAQYGAAVSTDEPDPVHSATVVRGLLQAVHEALDHHLAAVEERQGESDPAVFAAFEHARDALIAYDDALYDAYDEVLPVEVFAFSDEDDDDL